VLHVPYTDLFGGGGNLAPRRRGRHRAASPDKNASALGDDEARETSHRRELADRPARPVDAAAGDQLPESDSEPQAPPEPVIIPEGPLLGLGRLVTPPEAKAPPGARPYGSPREHLDELLDLVSARTARAIAHAWNSGRLSLPTDDLRPFEREVRALVGRVQTLAPDALAEAEERLAELTAIAGRRALASLAAGQTLPFVDVAREFDLSTTEAQVLLVAAGPALRGEIARLYGILANDENRPICDRYLIELILGGDDRPTRDAVARALHPDSTLVKYGLVRITSAANDQYLFGSVSVDPVLLGRLRGNRFGGTGPTDSTIMRWCERSLEELTMPDELKRDIVLELLKPSRDGRPHQVILRGRLGTGRRTLAAALAARIGKPLACIDCERLPRGGQGFAEALRIELRRAGLRGAVPCVSGLEIFDSTDAEGLEHVRAVFRAHPTPLVIRTSPEFRPPLDPGYLSFTIPPLSESERWEFWTRSLARRNLNAEGADRLASRFRIGPGTIESVIAGVEARLDDKERASEDITDRLDMAARQHIETRMGKVASHIGRLAKWEQVALPEDVLDSIREFIGRVRHRRTVYDIWGFDTRMSTARGLTALFYGPPGTGKSMVAGLIARELSLDLYRVDLARITSKWIGETEKNLAEVFDAGEDGQVVILFDEADSLFAKRTEVKSSVDRYANLEVNYLLQRLDTFEGVAILTTNLEGSIDNAFKRRMSLRLAFPFPDEEMRVRLWAAHIPPEVPTDGEFDFADLAKRFPMSGGYIRNSALRAAFLAAQENLPVTQDHLVRAIHLEYREMGKLAPGGRME
jgi:AAA+ superfamily predicted ATPase